MIMTVYADDTNLFTKEFCEQHNLVDIDLPRYTVRRYFDDCILEGFRTDTDDGVTDDGVFEEWLHEYTADDTVGLWGFARRLGSRPKVNNILM